MTVKRNVCNSDSKSNVADEKLHFMDFFVHRAETLVRLEKLSETEIYPSDSSPCITLDQVAGKISNVKACPTKTAADNFNNIVVTTQLITL